METNRFEHGATGDDKEARAKEKPSLLTVSQAYEHLIAAGLPRSKKTIRKWCRLQHVEIKQNVIPGGPKWLITRSSLDARIAEERLIDASLGQEAGSNRSDAVGGHTGADRSAPVRDDALVAVLTEQLAHERDARKAAEEKTRDLITMYHEISMASTRFGIEIAKGMQARGHARPLDAKAGSTRDGTMADAVDTVEADHGDPPAARARPSPRLDDPDGDNPGQEGTVNPLQ